MAINIKSPCGDVEIVNKSIGTQPQFHACECRHVVTAHHTEGKTVSYAWYPSEITQQKAFE
jgi:hypothetical protein